MKRLQASGFSKNRPSEARCPKPGAPRCRKAECGAERAWVRSRGRLEGGLSLVNGELDGPSTFGVFDSFPGDSGRQAHLSGRVAEALMGNVGEIIENSVIEPVDVVAARLSW